MRQGGALAYCAWLTKNGNGETHRLPTKEEWGIAAPSVQNDKEQQKQWAKYQRSHPYAQGKQFAEICELPHDFV